MSEMNSSITGVRVVVHPYATALPLGCLAFGIGNTILAALIARWIPASEALAVAQIMLGFVAPLELIACFLAFVSRDTGAATAMGIFAFGWVVFGLQLLTAGAAGTSVAEGLFLLLLAAGLAILAAGTFAGKPLIGSLFCVAMLRSISGALLQFGLGGAAKWTAVALGLVVALLAFYCGLGLLLEDVLQKPMAMMFRSGKAKTAMIAGLDEQLKNVAREAGIRQQL